MSSTINTSIATDVTLGSVSYPSPLTITAAGTVAPPAGSGNGLSGIYVPGPFSGLVTNDGLVLGGAGAVGYGAGGGIFLGINATLTLTGAGTIKAANGFGASIGGYGGIGVRLETGALFVNGSAGQGGNTILGEYGGVGSGSPTAVGGAGGAGILLSSATAQNFGKIVGGAGAYGTGQGGQGGVGADLVSGSSFDNEGTVIAGFGGASPSISSQGATGVFVDAASNLSNRGSIVGGNGTGDGTAVSSGGIGLIIRADGFAYNFTAGAITGGSGGSAPQLGGHGGYGVQIDSVYHIGGDGHFTLDSAGTFFNYGQVSGGAGGYGGGGTAGGGGTGMVLFNGVSAGNGGTLTGGAGGIGGTSGGRGGDGVFVSRYDTFFNGGLITGGHGGEGLDAQGGAGLVSAVFLSPLDNPLSATMTNNGTIQGGGGGGIGATTGEAGGAGVSLSGGAMVNNGLIKGGAGGGNLSTAAPGYGGNGATLYQAVLSNTGTIAGGYGASFAGIGVLVLSNATFGSTLINAGTIAGAMSGTGVQEDAVDFGIYHAVLEVDPGAVFIGNVRGDAGEGDVLALGGTSGSSLTGIGTEFTGFDTLDFFAGATWTAEGDTAGLAGGITIDGFAGPDAIILDGFTATSKTYVSGTGLELSDGTSTVTLDITGAFITADFTITDVAAGTEIQLLCFLKGTRILTPTGERLVEALAIGDLVMTRFSGMQRIKWIGRQSHGAALARNDSGKRPVCIKVGALAEGVPARDLYVSPGHAMLVEGNLLLASLMVNGVTVTQDWCPEVVEYYQIELEAHDCVVAEGAFAETYADCGDMRGQFANAGEFYALYPGYRPPEELSLCAPRPEKGVKLEAALRPVVARAAEAPGPLAGWLDRISAPWTVEGWARDEETPELPVLLEFLLDGESLGTALACHYRADLLAAGHSTSGRHGFRWTAPRDLPADAAMRLHIRRVADGARLPRSARAASPARLRVVA